MKLFILRHAQSVNNAEPDWEKWLADPHLTPLGEQQSMRVAQHLAEGPPNMLGNDVGYGITDILVSPMLRTLQTSAPIVECLNIKPHVWPLICEHQGTNYKKNGQAIGVAGMTRSAMSQQFPGYHLPPEITEQGWWNPNHSPEPIARCHQRGREAAAILIERARQSLREARDERVLLISHGTFSNGLIIALLDLLAKDYHYSHFNTGITRIDFLRADHKADIQEVRPVLRYSNRTEHLSGDLYSR